MKIQCNVCNKYRKSKKTKILYIFKRTLSLSIVYSKCGHVREKIFKEEELIEISNILGLITNIEEYQKIYNHVWRKHEARVILKKIDETRNYLTEETNQNELMSKTHENVYRVLYYIEHLLILISTVSGSVPISAFASLIVIPVGIASSTIVWKICVIIAGIKNYRSIIKKRKKKHDKILFLAKSKLKSIEVLISKVLIDLNISHERIWWYKSRNQKSYWSIIV